MSLVLLHEFGHHISYNAGEFSYPRPDWLREADANIKALKQSARASFDSDHVSKDVGEITAESIGRLLAGISLPVRLASLARRVIRESGVQMSIPLFEVKLWKPKAKSGEGKVPFTVPTSSLPRNLLREFYRKERARTKEVRP